MTKEIIEQIVRISHTGDKPILERYVSSLPNPSLILGELSTYIVHGWNIPGSSSIELQDAICLLTKKIDNADKIKEIKLLLEDELNTYGLSYMDIEFSIVQSVISFIDQCYGTPYLSQTHPAGVVFSDSPSSYSLIHI